jgi:outer membrane protein assembly factor BamA
LRARLIHTIQFNKILVLTCLFCNLVSGQTVSEILVQGNKKTKKYFIENISILSEGAVLDSLVIESDLNRLKRLPGIAHAYFQTEQKADGSYKVIYGVEENFTIIPTLSVFTTNNSEFAFRIGLYEFNGFGRNIAVGGFFQRDIFNSYGINFRAPYLFSRKLGIALNHQNLTTLEPVFLDTGTANYSYSNTSYEIMGLYEFNFNHRLELGVNFFTEVYEYQDGVTDVNVPQDLNVRKFLYKAIYEYSNIDYYYQYLEGFKSTFNFQYVMARDGNLPDFVIGWNDFNYYHRIGEKGNWASRLRLGLASNDDTPFAPFSVDNNLNIRGVGNTIDRGTGSIVLNTEYRYTFYDKAWFALQGNAFIDAGSWRNPGGQLDDFAAASNFRVYPGVGLRFIHKKIFNAIFRIDYGFGITDNATSGLVFGIGQYF